MNDEFTDLIQHYQEVGDRFFSDADWTYFDQVYDQSLDDHNENTRALLMSVMRTSLAVAMMERGVQRRLDHAVPS